MSLLKVLQSKILIPLNDQFLYLHNLNLENGYNDFHKIQYTWGFGGDKTIKLGHPGTVTNFRNSFFYICIIVLYKIRVITDA